jgi:hypothetical protein
MNYLDEISHELYTAGVSGNLRARIVDELADHLECDPQADLGVPRTLARQFADELGSSRACNAAYMAFGALAIIGIAVIVRLATDGLIHDTVLSSGDTAGLLGFALLAQIAFVAGGLGMLRALRLRARPVMSAADAQILSRRASVALAAGVLASAIVPMRASSYSHTDATDWIGIAAVAITLLAAAGATPALISAARLRPIADGTGGDLFDDLGPLGGAVGSLMDHSVTRFAGTITTMVFIAVAVSGLVENDWLDGIARGLAEAGAIVVCYAVLGSYLGLRRRVSRPTT